jgi:hypothetical protein
MKSMMYEALDDVCVCGRTHCFIWMQGWSLPYLNSLPSRPLPNFCSHVTHQFKVSASVGSAIISVPVWEVLCRVWSSLRVSKYSSLGFLMKDTSANTRNGQTSKQILGLFIYLLRSKSVEILTGSVTLLLLLFYLGHQNYWENFCSL